MRSIRISTDKRKADIYAVSDFNMDLHVFHHIPDRIWDNVCGDAM